jgi:hypothetical protein
VVLTSYTPAEWIAAILYDDWNPLGANPPANEYLKEGRALSEMLKRGASKDEIAQFLRQAADAYGTYPAPEARLADVIDKIMRVSS